MTTNTQEWIYKNGEKVFINRAVTRNEDKAHDYEMENVLAGLQTGSFDETEYYALKWERMQY